MNGRAERALRGTVFAAVATVTAAAAHTIGGGAPPSPLYCAILFALATPLAVAVTAARPSPWRAALAIGASQLLFHLAFALMGDIGASTAVASMPGHLHDAAHGAVATAVGTPSAAGAHLDMTLAHVIAGIVTIALVCRGETALCAIGAWIVRRAAVRAAGPATPSVPRRVDSVPALPRATLVLPPGLGRRGPPVVLSSPLAV